MPYVCEQEDQRRDFSGFQAEISGTSGQLHKAETVMSNRM